jgi:hypothetical protein
MYSGDFCTVTVIIEATESAVSCSGYLNVCTKSYEYCIDYVAFFNFQFLKI